MVITKPTAEILYQTHKDQKKNHCNRGQDCAHNQNAQKGSILVKGVNVVESGKLDKKKNKNQKGSDRDLSTVTSYNCDKKSHYSNTYPDLPKN